MIARSDFAMWIKSFGAEVSTVVNRRTTHVIANPDRKTTKVKKAARFPNIKIVNPEWMFQCCTRWEHVDETPYLIEIDPADRDGPLFKEDEDGSLSATGDEEADELADSPVTLDLTADTWAAVDDELDDFLNGSDTEAEGNSDSDTDSVRSDNSTTSDTTKNAKKRKRGLDSTNNSEAEESDSSVNSTTSRLQRRKKRTLERVSSLTNVVTADKSSGLPSPETTGPEEDQADDEDKAATETNGVAPDLQEDYDDALEAELLAGFGDSDGEE